MRVRDLTAALTPAVLLLGLLCVGMTPATNAQAGLQLFTAEWFTNSKGNACAGTMTPSGSLAPYCGTTGASAIYSNRAIPQGILCNPDNPRCPYQSTPTSGGGNFAPLGGSQAMVLYCTPYTQFPSGYNGAAGPRPAKGGSYTTGGPGKRPIPPLYRNPAHFTSLGQPKVTTCTATSTGYTTQNRTRFGANKGKVMLGNPVAGTWNANTTGTQLGGFAIRPAPENHKFGVRTTGQTGSFTNMYPYIYSYTYATLRNDEGVFGPGEGPGNFDVRYYQGINTVARAKVTQGPAKFGGTMRMLGALTAKACYYRVGGCSLGSNNWRYDAVGATASTSGSVVTKGYIAYHTAYYYHTALMQQSTKIVAGSRFSWTTGSATVTAVGRGPHKTVHYAHGYDNRDTATPSGKGVIQLVSPMLTRWLQPAANYETGGVAVVRIEFIEAAPPNFDADAVADELDNCSAVANSGQDDTDADGCGNLCDADYDDTGVVGWHDYFEFGAAFGTGDQEKCHSEPILGCTVDGVAFGYMVTHFGTVPGPSGTTAGTTACP